MMRRYDSGEVHVSLRRNLRRAYTIDTEASIQIVILDLHLDYGVTYSRKPTECFNIAQLRQKYLIK